MPSKMASLLNSNIGKAISYESPDDTVAPYKLLSNTYQRAQAQYPILNNLDMAFRVSANKDPNNYLETWPKNEPGEQGYRRPADFPMNKVGMEVFNQKTQPKDIMGDIVSHDLVNSHPVYKKAYEDFKSSITPKQQGILKQQYAYAQQNEGEKRPYEQWAEIAGLPAYFRGNLFDQWQKDGKTLTTEMYTPEQLKSFDALKQYMSGKQQ